MEKKLDLKINKKTGSQLKIELCRAKATERRTPEIILEEGDNRKNKANKPKGSIKLGCQTKSDCSNTYGLKLKRDADIKATV